MEDAKTSNQEHEGSISSFNSTFRQVNELVLAFRLGKHFNRFQWHLKWGVFTFDLSVGAPVWNHLESLLAELVKLHPSYSNDSPVKQIRSWRDEVIAMLEIEQAADEWQSGIDEITKAAQTGTTNFEIIRSYFSDVFKAGDQINSLLRSVLRNANTDDASGELAIASFDLGAGLDMAVMPPLNDLQIKNMILQWDEMRNPPVTICGNNDPALPPWISTKEDIQPPDHESPPSSNITSDVIRTALDPYSPPVSEISRLKSFCKLLGISDELPRFKGTIQAREESLKDVISKIENELRDESNLAKINDNDSNQSNTPSKTSGITAYDQHYKTLIENVINKQYDHLSIKLPKSKGSYRRLTKDRDRILYCEYFINGKSLNDVFILFNEICKNYEWDELKDPRQVQTGATRFASQERLPIDPRKQKKK